MTTGDTNYLILEENQYIALELSREVKRIRPEYSLVGIFEEASEAMDVLKEGRASLAIAEVEAADGNSVKAFAKAEIKTPTIFISDSLRHAALASSLNVVDYILHSVSASDLERAFLRLDRHGDRTDMAENQ